MNGRKVIITIESRQSDHEGRSKVELVTEGELKTIGGGFEVSYDETEATGFAGSHTRLTYSDGYITMDRSGSTSTKLILELGKRHLCNYGTPYGDMVVGVSTSMVKARIDAEGAQMEFHYTIDINSESIGDHEIVLSARYDISKS